MEKNIIIFITLILSMLITCKRSLHMFQQNRYEFGRYTKWLSSHMTFAPFLVLLMVAFLFLFAIFLNNDFLWILMSLGFILIAILYYLDEKKKNYIKPLVITARVKRQIIVYGILILLCSYFVLEKLPLAILPIYSILLPWFLIIVVGWITYPIENAIRHHYMNDAKRILKEHNDLIKIGITGSYGKTSTKNAVQAILSEQYNSLMTPASFNTPNGITITIRNDLKPIHQVFVCEMGADHVGDIKELVDYVEPYIGIVTSIGPQHLMTFGSQENIIKEKMQLLERLHRDSIGILNYDNEFIRNYQIQNKDIHVITYGIEEEHVDYRAINIQVSPNGTTFDVLSKEGILSLETKLLGSHNVLNILSAVACAKVLKVEDTVIRKAVKNMKAVEHRLERKVMNGYTFIDDAFNSNPIGSKMALDVLSMMPNQRVIVTPGMIDLGNEQDHYNKEFGKYMKDKADLVILVGKSQTKAIYEGLEEVGFDLNRVFLVDTVKEAFVLIYQKTSPNDVILLENDLPDAFNN